MVAAYKIRAVPINVNYRYVADELAYLFANAELRALVLEAALRPAGRLDPGPGCPRLEHLVVVDDGSDGAAASPDAVDYEDLLAAQLGPGGFPAPVRRRSSTSSTPVGRPGCPRAWSGARRTSSSPP